MRTASIILFEQLCTIDKRDLKQYIGRLSRRPWNRMNRTLAESVGLKKYIAQSTIACLCPTCLKKVENSGHYIIEHIEPLHDYHGMCVNCQQERNEDYELIEKKRIYRL